MAHPPDSPPPDLPDALAVPRSRWRVQWIWLVPLIAVLIGVWLAARAILEQGPTITISFKTGEGLEAGKTKIKFKDVDIGVVKSVALSKDYSRVVATAELTQDASNMLVDDTRFWVVRPRVSGGTVSGIGTLLSGAYIGMDIGKAKGGRRDFVGLETPPVFASDVPGHEYVLRSDDLGSVDVGTPVYFRRLQVGQVVAYELDPNGKGVTLRVFVNAPYDKFVTPNTRFWHASGVDVSLNTEGVKVNTQSLVSILIGGLAFQSPPDAPDESPAPAHTTFQLFSDRTEAMKTHDRIVVDYVFNFKESVRGLVVGAPVDFRGIQIGEVAAIHTRFDPVTRQFSIPVQVKFYPERFTSRYESEPRGGRLTRSPREMADFLVSRGMRAQLKTGSLITGQLYIALDFFPNAPKAEVNWDRDPPELPTVPSGLQSLQESVSELMARMNKIPFESIGKNAQQTLARADTLLQSFNTDLVPQARDTLTAARTTLDSANSALQPDSALQQDTTDAVRELSRTAAALRSLAEYLERHPEALLRGKAGDGK
ncbi:intermembrane transport protein PqiB [Paraburkholderia humisilvae]|uniref:Intermembrane transport protein PqiB n=1 Tax=Paraburkholderia humisilvae TaxID=627669 RepID=A0A6J5EB41_9BURK|nr:MlaD family protein [Paraburkholderia humisilvae]CAB3762382.1 Intermembrane transport protein PqiB [Paraburkholderia humisilvae]